VAFKLRTRDGAVWVDENTVREHMRIPKSQDLVVHQGNGNVRRMNPIDYFDPQYDTVESIPVIRQGYVANPHRVIEDASTLAKEFVIELDADLQWLKIENFRTPPRYMPVQTKVLMMIPPDYPQTPPGLGHHNVYLRKGLRRVDGQSIQHHYREVVYCKKGCCDLSPWGWYWWCFKDIKWDPRLNDFLSIARALNVCMDEA